MRIDPEEYRRVPLRAHALLEDVPLHDVWALELAGGPPDVSILDCRSLITMERFTEANPIVRFLFALRGWMGRVFGWDEEPAAPRSEPDPRSYQQRLSDADRAATLIPPGTSEGPFRTLFVSDRESISEIRNPTVHAFLVYALLPTDAGHRLYWAVYVKPVGRITAFYMALIDPFRRFFIYPAILKRIRVLWAEEIAARRPDS